MIYMRVDPLKWFYGLRYPGHTWRLEIWAESAMTRSRMCPLIWVGSWTFHFRFKHPGILGTLQQDSWMACPYGCSSLSDQYTGSWCAYSWEKIIKICDESWMLFWWSVDKKYCYGEWMVGFKWQTIICRQYREGIWWQFKICRVNND